MTHRHHQMQFVENWSPEVHSASEVEARRGSPCGVNREVVLQVPQVHILGQPLATASHKCRTWALCSHDLVLSTATARARQGVPSPPPPPHKVAAQCCQSPRALGLAQLWETLRTNVAQRPEAAGCLTHMPPPPTSTQGSPVPPLGPGAPGTHFLWSHATP